MSGPISHALLGAVVSFDTAIGLGTIRDQDGDVWPFHCISIADGTRSIDVGAEVTFSTAFQVMRNEAVNITLR